ncbi:MAG TPA: PQQ-binding-like beta-propeller repeat protein [Candidatus Brocadiia bacterium]|nr:PQQ-binding-like beta-propeller repeat protein [Candidatus Brocadiia bacterium]
MNSITLAFSCVLCVLTLAASPAYCADSGVPAARLITSTEPGWPQFRGPRRDGICDETGLLPDWPGDGPKLLWKVDGVGHGYSSPTVVGERIFITGDVGKELRIFALDLQGKHVWQAANGGYWKDPYPGSRSTVAFSAGRVYNLNAHGRMACFDAETGKEVWALNILERFGGKNIGWGISECLLVDEKNVYATAGGSEALLVALDKATGELRWKSEPLNDTEGERDLESASYVAPILVEFAGRRLLIGCSVRHLVCADADTGKIQWVRRVPTTYLTLTAMPALVGSDRIFITGPQGKGGKLFQLIPPDGKAGLVGAKELWKTKLDSAQGCVISANGRIYGAFYPEHKGWAAVDAKTGEVLFQNTELIKGSFILADARMYALCEDGLMTLLEPAEKTFVTHGSFRLIKDKTRDVWAHPVILNGRLYLRYHDTLYCYDVRSG